MSQRIKRVNELLREEISEILLREVDFGDTLVTITEVNTSPDLRQAKIKISVNPIEKNESALKIIKNNIYKLQQALNKKLHLKFVPKIIFEIDQAEAKAQRLEEIFKEIKKDKKD